MRALLFLFLSIGFTAICRTADMVDEGMMAEDDGGEYIGGEEDSLDTPDDEENIESQIGLDHSDIENRLKMIFPIIDSDADGIATKQEITKWLEDVHHSVEKRQGKLEFEAVDKNNDGLADLQELKNAYSSDSPQDEDVDIQLRFSIVDANGDGMLQIEEFAKLLHVGENPKLLELEVAEILKAQDKNGDQAIDYEEFRGNEEAYDEESIRKEFGEYDANGDGEVDKGEIVEMIVKHGKPDHQREAETLIADSSESGDSISLEDMLNNADTIASSKLTDYGEMLRYPEEFDLGLPFSSPAVQSGREEL